MKRVSSQDVDMKIEPADVPGESVVVVTVKRTKPWTAVASVDNSGTRATGRLQGNLSLGIDIPLGLNDIFNVALARTSNSVTGGLARMDGTAPTRSPGATGQGRCRATRTPTISR